MNVFEMMFEAGRVRDPAAEDYAAAAKALKGKKIYISPELKLEFGDDWNSMRKQALGKGVMFTNKKSDMGIDVHYLELATQFPGQFSAEHTDLSYMVENLIGVLNSGTEYISLAEEARRYGGPEAVEAYRTHMIQDYFDAVGNYYEQVHGAKAAKTSAIEQARQKNREILSGWGEIIKLAIEQKTNMAKDERLRGRAKEDIAGIYNLAGFDVLPDGALGNPAVAEQLIEWHGAKKKIARIIKEAETRLRPTPVEMAFAADIAEGNSSLTDVPQTMRVHVVAELSDYYKAEAAFKGDLIAKQRSDINYGLDEWAEARLKDKDEYKAKSTRSLQYGTPEENMIDIFGPQQGALINKEMSDRIGRNAAEQVRFFNAMTDKLRNVEDGMGKNRKLSGRESAVAMLVLEGRNAEKIANERVKDFSEHNMIRDAAEFISRSAGFRLDSSDLKTGKDYTAVIRDAHREYNLTAEDRAIAESYARWLWVQQLIKDGKVDGVIVENAANIAKELFDEAYRVGNIHLVTHGYDPIAYRSGYAPHMQPDSNDSIFKIAANAMGFPVDVMDLPTSIIGLTGALRPNMKWNPHFQQRLGQQTKYDLIGGFESYFYHLGMILYHTDDIMRLRSAEKYLRRAHASDHVNALIEQARDLKFEPHDKQLDFLRVNNVIESGTQLSEGDTRAAIDRYVKELFDGMENDGKHGPLAAWFNNQANVLAGKQSSADRGFEAHWGRKNLSLSNKLLRRFSRAAVAGNLVSAFVSQKSQWSFIHANNPKYFYKALSECLSGKATQKEAWIRDSNFLTGKRGLNYINLSPGQKYEAILYKPLQVFDCLTASIAVRSEYLAQIADGKNHAEAIEAADRYGRSAMGSRMTGEKPIAFHAKSPGLQALHMFQVEVLRQYKHARKDLPRHFQEMARTQGKTKATASAAAYIARYLLFAFMINRIDEEIFGVSMNPFDILGLLARFFAAGNKMTANDFLAILTDDFIEGLFEERPFGTEGLNDEAFDWTRAGAQGFGDAMFQMPFARNAMGLIGYGNESAPWPNLWDVGETAYNALTNEDGVSVPELGKAALSLGAQTVPGGRQIQKTALGLETILRGGRYHGYGEDAKLQYPVERTPWNIARAALFGNSSLTESREHWASGRGGLTKDQTAVYESLVVGGVDPSVLFEAIHEWRRIGSDKDAVPESSEREQMRRDVIRDLDISDDQKFELYAGLYPSAGSRVDKFAAIMKTGLRWSDVMDAYDTWAAFSDIDELSPSGKSTGFARWVDTQGYSRSQASKIKELLTFSITMTAEASGYERLLEAGLSPDRAHALVNELSGLDPLPGASGITDMQKYRVINESGLSERDKLAAIGSIMGTDMLTEAGNPTQWAKLQEVISSGIGVGSYLDIRDAGRTSVDNYLKYYEPMQDPRSAMLVTQAATALEPEGDDDRISSLQRMRAVVDAVGNVDMQLTALTVPMTDMQHIRAMIANDHDIVPEQYIFALELLDEATKGRSVRNDDVTSVVRRMDGMSRNQRAALWQLLTQSTSGTNNPFNARVGQRVADDVASRRPDSGGSGAAGGSRSAGGSPPRLVLPSPSQSQIKPMQPIKPLPTLTPLPRP